MANKTNLTIRVEPKLKGQVKTLFKKLGMDVSTATNVFYRQALRCHGFPFPVTLDVPGEDTQQDIHEDMDEDSFLYALSSIYFTIFK